MRTPARRRPANRCAGSASPSNEHRCGTSLRYGPKRRPHHRWSRACDAETLVGVTGFEPAASSSRTGDPLFGAVLLSTRGGVLSTIAVRLVRPVRSGGPRFVPFCSPASCPLRRAVTRTYGHGDWGALTLSLIHISEPTRRTPISYAVFC